VGRQDARLDRVPVIEASQAGAQVLPAVLRGAICVYMNQKYNL
jgi:hypothetical protein